MKSISPALQSHLSSGTTTLCWCWKIARRDSVVLGFTDHDTPLAFAGTTYEAATGFTASQVQSGLGLAVDNLTVSGALSSDSLNESDLAAGLFDNASIEIWRVNWAAPDQRVLMRKGSLGEVKRGSTGFAAEVRGLAHALNQPVGRVFAQSCDAVLGDARCGTTVTPVAGTVITVADARRFTAAGLVTFADQWFAGGKLTFTSGANAGRAMEVKTHMLVADVASFSLWQAMSEPIAPGDSFTVTPGCDKQFATCKTKFANTANFRGFPFMPGNDAAFAPGASTTPLDGGSRYGN
jgi:uncharacterized phage protein (TIGR02218 family)